MSEDLKLLILAEPPGEQRLAPSDQKLDLRISRKKALRAISSSGGRVRHDSGGRLIVIEIPGTAEPAIMPLFPGARLESVDYDAKKAVPDLDSNEMLFLEALKMRYSKSFRDAKRRRKVGESPEEKLLRTAPCVREDY